MHAILSYLVLVHLWDMQVSNSRFEWNQILADIHIHFQLLSTRINQEDLQSPCKSNPCFEIVQYVRDADSNWSEAWLNCYVMICNR